MIRKVKRKTEISLDLPGCRRWLKLTPSSAVQSFSFFPVGQPDDQATRHPFTVFDQHTTGNSVDPANFVFHELPPSDIRAENGPFHLARRRRAHCVIIQRAETITTSIGRIKPIPFVDLCRRLSLGQPAGLETPQKA